MSAIAEEIEETVSASALPFTPPPGEDDLPSEDGVPMETERHKLQMDLLIYPLRRHLAQQRPDSYVNGNMFVYYRFDEDSGESQAIGPDVMVALHVEPREHKSWLVWKEGKGPDVVIELLSDSTAKHDKSRKKHIYQDALRVPEYFWFHPFRPEDFVGHRLDGGVYHPIRPDAQGHLSSVGLDLLLRRWQGVYAGVETLWLRWALPDGTPLPTPDEAADAATAAADAATAAADAATARAEKLAAQLRALGLEPEV
jgi:Uma2 family endonuclease